MKFSSYLKAMVMAAALTGTAYASVDGMDESIRPCVDRVKQSLNNAYVEPISEAELKQCYEGAMMFDKYLTKTLPEFAAWIGVRATMEKVEEQFGKLLGLGSRKNARVNAELPKSYKGVPVIRAFELMRDYEENESEANAAYRGKTYVIVGTVNLIKKDQISQKVVIELQGDNLGLFNCYVYLDDSQQRAAAALNKDDIVSLQGVISGISTELRLEVNHGVIIKGNLS